MTGSCARTWWFQKMITNNKAIGSNIENTQKRVNFSRENYIDAIIMLLVCVYFSFFLSLSFVCVGQRRSWTQSLPLTSRVLERRNAHSHQRRQSCCSSLRQTSGSSSCTCFFYTYFHRNSMKIEGSLSYNHTCCILLGIHVWAEIKRKLQKASTSCIHSPIHAFGEPALVMRLVLGGRRGIRTQGPGKRSLP